MRIDTNTVVSGGHTQLSADGTALHLSAASKVGYDIPCRVLAIMASGTNSAYIYVAASGFYGVAPSSVGYPLTGDASIIIDVNNVNKMQIAGTATDRVAWIAIVD